LSKLQPQPTILMVCGAKEVGAFNFPPGLDCLALPSIEKSALGEYRSRRLNVPLAELVKFRSATIRAAMESFDPDIVIADKVPGGFRGELTPALRWLKSRGRAKCVLGLREILDEPSTAIREWKRDHCDEVIDEHYSSVWVYGDQNVYDTAREYEFAQSTTKKCVYTGYLNAMDVVRDEPGEEQEAISWPTNKQTALCIVGGGDDGEAIATAFADATLPPQYAGVLVTGPFMSPTVRERLKMRAAASDRLHVHEFVTEPERFISKADCVISMGGYNTVCEVLAAGKPLLTVPRVDPRREQLIRAQRMHALGLLDYLLPSNLNAGALSSWVGSTHSSPRDARNVIRFDGLRRVGELAQDLVSRRSGSSKEAELAAG
jgi:predicted glycosyltransferase